MNHNEFLCLKVLPLDQVFHNCDYYSVKETTDPLLESPIHPSFDTPPDLRHSEQSLDQINILVDKTLAYLVSMEWLV